MYVRMILVQIIVCINPIIHIIKKQFSINVENKTFIVHSVVMVMKDNVFVKLNVKFTRNVENNHFFSVCRTKSNQPYTNRIMLQTQCEYVRLTNDEAVLFEGLVMVES